MATYNGIIAELKPKEVLTRSAVSNSGVLEELKPKETLIRSAVTLSAIKAELKPKEFLIRQIMYLPGKILIYDKGFNKPRQSPNEIVWTNANP